MVTRVGINGFGRIGREFVRAARDRDVQVVAVNDITDAATLAYLLERDSTYGPFPGTVEVTESGLLVDGEPVRITAHRDPLDIDWAAVEADVVIESTGRFRDRDTAAGHLKGGARKVIISAPGKGEVDATFVLGVNDYLYDPLKHDVISNASCTTNCLAPMVKVLHDAFGVEQGFLTTVHGYTNDQTLLDAPHKDLRRARSAAVNLIPTSTGAARALGLIMPELAGRFDGIAVRAPVEDGSLCDLAVILQADASADDVNAAFHAAATGGFGGIIRYEDRPMVSRDVIGDPSSCVFDSGLTQARGRLVKAFGWYDNEWGYANRLVDLTEIVGAQR